MTQPLSPIPDEVVLDLTGTDEQVTLEILTLLDPTGRSGLSVTIDRNPDGTATATVHSALVTRTGSYIGTLRWGGNIPTDRLSRNLAALVGAASDVDPGPGRKAS